MDITKIFWDLAVILLATKLLGMLMRKLGLPQVVGAVIAGLLIGPAIWGQFGWWSPIQPTEAEGQFLDGIAEIGVVLILFSAGLETDTKELKRSGLPATLIALGGVIVPMALGFLVAVPFLGGFSALSDSSILLDAIFIGVILTATSVGITVETLKEMGKLSGKVGTTILSAAIIDDVIGIVVLSVVIGFKDPSANPWMTILMTVAFFVAAIIVGYFIKRLFKYLSEKYDHTRRIPILSLVVCFVYAYAAEAWFGIADITGAYFAGLILCNVTKARQFVAKKFTVTAYMVFTPVFFANIGMMTNMRNMNSEILIFALLLIVAAVISKIMGCGLGAKLCGMSGHQSLVVGIGMVARSEVALMVAQKGLDSGLIPEVALPAIVLSIVASALVTPILLKIAVGKNPTAQL